MFGNQYENMKQIMPNVVRSQMKQTLSRAPGGQTKALQGNLARASEAFKNASPLSQ